jgi:hypothetical protein
MSISNLPRFWDLSFETHFANHHLTLTDIYRIITKQWPLAGEFSEFEYSPKICQIFVTRSGEFGEY